MWATTPRGDGVRIQPHGPFLHQPSTDDARTLRSSVVGLARRVSRPKRRVSQGNNSPETVVHPSAPMIRRRQPRPSRPRGGGRSVFTDRVARCPHPGGGISPEKRTREGIEKTPTKSLGVGVFPGTALGRGTEFRTVASRRGTRRRRPDPMRTREASTTGLRRRGYATPFNSQR